MRDTIAKKLKQHRLVVVIRLAEQAWVKDLINCLVLGGVKALEITSNTPGFCEEINQSRKLYPDILIGAGTITNAVLADQAIAAGAQFLVTPNTSKEIVDIAHKHDIPVLMGALTPTEILNAVNYGADIVKIFPAGSMGLGYFKGLKGPFKDVTLFPVGGIGLNDIQDWLAAGAAGIGVGNSLARAVHDQKEIDALIRLTKEFVAATSPRGTRLI